jgi:XRE family aerobic/anaerobic benzoate catabolism transcriptional regulator
MQKIPGRIMTASADSLSETETESAAFLGRVGERVRNLRARRGMTRRLLARDSGVSERYLAELEAGRGNISIGLLRQVAQAMGVPLAELAEEIGRAHV